MILICDQCLYAFEGDAIPLRCPDCGAKKATRVADKEEIEDYKRIRKELAKEEGPGNEVWKTESGVPLKDLD